MRRSSYCIALLLVPALAGAQRPAAYLPTDYWGMPYLEQWIVRGIVADPAPLTRPLRRADAVAALEAADSFALAPRERRVLRSLLADLAPPAPAGPTWEVRVDAGAAAATHARRDPLREAGPGHVTVGGGVAALAQLGPVAVGTHPFFDTRLKWDPDYQGKQDRVIAGRNAAAYVAARWKYADLFFGSLDRAWGPPAAEGLLLSSAPYSYDHFALGLGTDNVRLDAVLAQLDDVADTTGVLNHRYWVAHRLLVRPPGATTIAVWEGTVLAGPDRQFEPWYANVVNLGLLAQYDQGLSGNSLVGGDVTSRIGRVRVFGSILLDDIQVDRGGSGDNEPPSYGLTTGLATPFGSSGATVTAYYTRVSNLAYRTPNPAEGVLRRGVGLGRNFSDYDQVTVRGAAVLGPGLLVQPEVTLLRQGEGDLRAPFPPVSAYATTPTFLDGVVERTVRLALAARLGTRHFLLAADGGVHLVENARHVSGATTSRFVGSISVTYRLRWHGELP